jgi:D-alanyl-D-alanine dipeptidase
VTRAFAPVLVLVVSGCGRPTTSPPPDPRGVRPHANASQLVTGVVDGWSSTRVQLRVWRRAEAGWESVSDAWSGVVGRDGLAWPDEPPDGRAAPSKREGDGRSPAGMLSLRHVYGYAARPPPGGKLPYTAVDASWECVDDPRSPHYARILDARTVTRDWGSSEQMRRDDDAYTWVVDTEFNSQHVAGAGSCIFLHVWAGEDSSTLGCTAMAEPRLAHLISILEPDAAYVLLPRGEYEALRVPWGLPEL